ncbi:hypothetical protein QBC42DRAFT_265315 [Cladorrhinum samala]|uniref:chitin synthase n=1 Tax=Cladorrhinum samala TaxID=585594 RepID=A0AAV9HX04_9PEZI|nr:hypothetical protein QBC42DRAFT_265315 [Cladorrhinum samala]
MADPLSIVTGCVGLVATIGTMAVRITSFVRAVREARGDLDSISRELASLQTILDLIQADASKILPETLIRHLEGIIENCNAVMKDLERVLDKYQQGGRRAVSKWATYGKQDVAGLRARLETNTRSLNLAVDYMSLITTIENKELATGIKEDTTEIKQDTAKILEEIACLRALLPPDVDAANGYMLDRYLEQMSTFTERALDCVESDDETEFFDAIEAAPEPQAARPPESASPRDRKTGNTADLKSVTAARTPLRVPDKPPASLPQSRTELLDVRAKASPSRMKLGLRITVSSRVLSKIKPTHPTTTEFTEARHSAITCGPREFASCGYVLRGNTRPKPRMTGLFFSVLLDDVDSSARFETLIKIWSGFDRLRSDAYLPPEVDTGRISNPVGEHWWKHAVLHLHLKEPPRGKFKKALEALGIRPRIVEEDCPSDCPSDCEDHYEANKNKGKGTQWHMWEYTSGLRVARKNGPEASEPDYGIQRSDCPIQTIVTYPGAKKLSQISNSRQWADWTDAIAGSLQAKMTVVGESSEVRAVFKPEMVERILEYQSKLPKRLSISQIKTCMSQIAMYRDQSF